MSRSSRAPHYIKLSLYKICTKDLISKTGANLYLSIKFNVLIFYFYILVNNLYIIYAKG